MGVASCQRRLNDQSPSSTSPRESCSIEEEFEENDKILKKPKSPSNRRIQNKQTFFIPFLKINNFNRFLSLVTPNPAVIRL